MANKKGKCRKQNKAYKCSLNRRRKAIFKTISHYFLESLEFIPKKSNRTTESKKIYYTNPDRKKQKSKKYRTIQIYQERTYKKEGLGTNEILKFQ